MLFNKTIVKVLPCKVNIVSNNLIAVVIPQFEIGLIKYLVILYVAEQFKIIVTVESPGDFILVQVR